MGSQTLNAILPFLGICLMKLKKLNWDILADFKTLWSLYVYYLLCTRKFLNASVDILLVKVSFKEIPHYHFTAFFAFVISTMCGPVFAVVEKSPLFLLRIKIFVKSLLTVVPTTVAANLQKSLETLTLCVGEQRL